MAISVNWPTKVISVPQSYLTLISGNRYELDVDQFRLDLRSLEDDPEGMPFLRTHRHNTEVTLGGVTYARVVEIINGYTVEFETGSYIVELANANNNILDQTTYTGVSVRERNSAGLITVSSGSGLSSEQDTKLDEVHERLALNTGRPVTHADDGIDSTNLNIDITDNQDGTFTEQRQ